MKKRLRGTTVALTMNTLGHRRQRKNTGVTLTTFRVTGYINAESEHSTPLTKKCFYVVKYMFHFVV